MLLAGVCDFTDPDTIVISPWAAETRWVWGQNFHDRDQMSLLTKGKIQLVKRDRKAIGVLLTVGPRTWDNCVYFETKTQSGGKKRGRNLSNCFLGLFANTLCLLPGYKHIAMCLQWAVRTRGEGFLLVCAQWSHFISPQTSLHHQSPPPFPHLHLSSHRALSLLAFSSQAPSTSLYSTRRPAAYCSTVPRITFPPVSIQSPRPVIGTIHSFHCSPEGFITIHSQWGFWLQAVTYCSSGMCSTGSIMTTWSCRVSDYLTDLRSCHGNEPPLILHCAVALAARPFW